MKGYMDLIDDDLIEPIRPLLERNLYKFTSDGKLEADYRMKSETPWVHIRQDTIRNCALWSQVWFNYYRIIPSGCQNCWKVVIRPKTIESLFAAHDILQEIDRPSKCGIEKRYSVPALYGCYLYNNSEQEGLECLALVKEKFWPGVECFLKRGCTEMEHTFGDSRKWEVKDEQIKLERRLEDLFIDAKKRSFQSDELKRHIMANWIRFAYANGDPTVSKFISRPLYPKYVKYGENALAETPQHITDGEAK